MDEKIFENELKSVNDADYVRVITKGKSGNISTKKLLGMANIEEREQNALQNLDSATASAMSEIESAAPELRQEVAQLSSQVIGYSFVLDYKNKVAEQTKLDLELISGYISTGGKIIPSSGAQYTEPILFKKGQLVLYTLEGESSTYLAEYKSGAYIPIKTTGSGRRKFEAYYILEEDKYLSFCGFNDTINVWTFGKIAMQTKLDLVLNSGYIDSNGNIRPSSGAQYTEPILFKKGQLVLYTLEGESSTYLAEYKSGAYIPIKTTGRGRRKFEAYYILDSDKYLSFSGFSNTINVWDSIVSNANSERLDAIEKKIKTYDAEIFGEITKQMTAFKNIELNVVLGKYIDKNGIIRDSSNGFYSEPYLLEKGKTIKFHIEGSECNLMSIKNNGQYFGVVKAGSYDYYSGEFTAESDVLIVFSGTPNTLQASVYGIFKLDEIEKKISNAEKKNERLTTIKVSSKNIRVNGNDIIGLNTSKNEVECSIEYISNSEHFIENGIIAYQGNSSLRAPKKGFTLGFEEKHRFGTWISMDEFHCKGYYTDWMHARDIVANKIYEQMMHARDFDVCRPWKAYNDFGEHYLSVDIEDGALAHIDGEPCELYINDIYWGLYSLNIKKDRSNYCLNKNNVNHIQIDPDGATLGKPSPNWAGIEIRNPKKDDGNTEFIEGIEPNDGAVKRAILLFNSKLNAVTSSTTKEQLSEFLNITELIDTILLCQFANIWDSFGKNTLFTTWDAVHWSPLMYDMDLSFGIGYAGGSSIPEGEMEWSYNHNTFSQKAYSHCPWLSVVENILKDDIKIRYKELKDKEIFTVENIVRLFKDFCEKVGRDVYTDDLARWSYPSHGGTTTTGISYNFFESISRINNWIGRRIEYLDSKYS